MQHEHAAHVHVDVVEVPGTYRSNWACIGLILVGILAIAYGLAIIGGFPGFGAATMAVGALVIVLSASRLFAGTSRWASQAIIILGAWTWYSGHFFGVNPNVFSMTELWAVYLSILLGLGYVFLGTWTALGAPGKVEWEPFFYEIEP